MCRSIKPLFNFEPPVQDEEVRVAALQYVRKISGFNKASRANEAAFYTAVVEMTWHTHSERAGTFTSVAASNWEMVITTFDGKTTITARGPETKASEAEFPAGAEFFGIVFKLGTFM